MPLLFQNNCQRCIGNILAIGFIYAMFVPNIFDFISTIAAWLLGIVIIITVLLGIGSRE